MKTKSFVIICDTVFASVITFILSVVFISFFLKPPYSLILSLLVSLLVALFLYKFFNKKHTGKLLKKADLENADNLINYLGLCKKTEVLKLFETVFTNLNYSFTKRNGGLYLTDKKQAHFFDFSFDGITKSTIVKAYNYISSQETAVIYCTECSKEIRAFANKFDNKIKIAEKGEIYTMLNDANCLPKIEKPLRSRPKIKEIVMEFFTKKRAKSYFMFGSTFLFLSFFVMLKVYYIVVGSIFLALSLCCLFLKPITKN